MSWVVWRVEVDGLPPVDVAGDFAIGSAASAQIRVPGTAVRSRHVEIAGGRWRTTDAEGEIAGGVDLAIAGHRIRIAPAPAGVAASSPQRTASLARELVRALLGASAAPSLEVERGAIAGARRVLAPPESCLVIGRGDEAGWIIADEDLSRAHAEVRRGWDGVTVHDLGSKNGTRVDGAEVHGEPVVLRDGARLELGPLALRYRDPAERHHEASEPPQPATPAPRGPFVLAIAICAAALALLVALIATSQ